MYTPRVLTCSSLGIDKMSQVLVHMFCYIGDEGSLQCTQCHAFKIFLSATLLLNFYLVNQQHSSCEYVSSIRVENSVDPDQKALSETS